MKPEFRISLPASVFAGVLLSISPVFRRRDMLFGVHVPPEWNDSVDARRIILRYRLLIALSVLIEIVLGANGYLPAGAILLTLGAAAAFALARRATRPWSVVQPSVRSAALTPDTPVSPATALAGILPLLLLAVAALWMQRHWNQIPDRFPVHYDIHGNPNRWAHRTWRGVFGPVLIGIPTVLLMLTLAWGLARRSPRGSDHAAGFRRNNLRALIGIGWAVSVLFCWITLSPLVHFKGSTLIGLWVVAVVIGLVIWTVKGAMNMDAADNTPDEAWKWGMIYYNPSDPAFVVQKRFGIGYTINLGNRMSWAPAALLVIILVVTFAMVKGG